MRSLRLGVLLSDRYLLIFEDGRFLARSCKILLFLQDSSILAGHVALLISSGACNRLHNSHGVHTHKIMSQNYRTL